MEEKIIAHLKSVRKNLNIKTNLDFINDYLSLILIIPAILGGLWQIIELSSISFSYIRFFSVTQILPDGLLILFVFSILGLSYLILKGFSILAFQEDNKDEEIEKAPWASIILFLFSIATLAVIFVMNFKIIENIDSIWGLLFLLPLNIVFTFFSWGMLKSAEFHLEGHRILEFTKDVYVQIGICYLGLQCMSIFFFLMQFHYSYMFPTELKNIENLSCKIEKIAPETKFEILYSNDKYIFLKLYKPSKDVFGKKTENSTLILNFEDILNDEACSEKLKLNNEIKTESVLNKLNKKIDSLKISGDGAVIPNKGL